MEEPNAVPSSSQNPNTLLTDDRYERIMNNLTACVFSKISPSGNIAPQLKTHIEQRLHEFFPSFRTPSHPPYASMIQRAISELNNEEGSTQEEISAFIKREYEHLPWGHESFLSHHLGKLCGNMELACVNNERYILLVEEDCELKEMTGSSTKKEGRRGRQGRKKGRVTKKKKKQSQAEKQQIEVLEDTLQAMELKQHKDQMTTLERFLMRLTKDESEIKLANGEGDPEFAEWKWANPEEVVEQVVDYRRPTYEEVVRTFQ